MLLSISKDYFNNPTPPRLFLCTTSGKRIQELPYYDGSLNAKWNSYSELSFSMDRSYVDILDGSTKIHPAFDKIESLRQVLVDDMGLFILQDTNTAYGDKDEKQSTAFSLEYSTSSKFLEEFRINTGDVDSKEVIYAEKYNLKYDPNNPYIAASGNFDPYKRYYEKTYSDTDSYTYTETQVIDTTDYNKRKDKLFVRSYKNVQFYNENEPELSLLHLIMEKIPEWKIGNVDATLWHKERKFDEERVAVYDFLMNNVANTFNCVVEWNTLTRTISIYEEAEDGIEEDNQVQTRFNTDVFISRDNLASQIEVKISSDDIKTKLKVSGSDDLNIREVNLGKNYLINLDYYHDDEWMDTDLYEAYDDYLNAVKENSEAYTTEMQGWIAAYNQWNDLMNAVPADAGVVLIGDEFEKLYCVYEPIDNAYLNQTITDSDVESAFDDLYEDKEFTVVINKSTLKDKETFCVQGYRFIYVKADNNFKCMGSMTTYNINELTGGDEPQKGKLALYHVNEDTEANKTDNILLKLKNSSSDIATIRIYNGGTKDKPTYYIQSVVVNASSGISKAAKKYTMSQWVNGTLTAEKMGLEKYTVDYIGTMGAYFVLAKDETQEATLEEYGINLLKEKHETYVKIFQTQTEAMFSQEKYQCIVQDEEPEGDYEKSTRWLDTNSNPVALKEYNGTSWKDISAEMSKEDQANYENYQRYINNYEKMVAVQEMLIKKQTEAEYLRNGYAATNGKITRIDLNEYTRDPSRDNALYLNGYSLYNNMEQIAKDYFGDGVTITGDYTKFNDTLPLYVFTTSKYQDKTFAVYLQGTTPYVAYENSQSVYQIKKDYISKITDFETFFTKDQWARLSPFIREDEFSDDNFLLTGYESEEERLKICEELMETAAKELQTLAQPSLEFSMTMANILALPEFEPLMNQFQLGNFVRVYVRDGYVKRARLLEVNLSFDDFSDFSCTFGNLVTTKSEIDKHADLLKQAVTAGKTVATAAGDWQMAVDKANRIEEEIMNGLANATLEVGRASNQSIIWDDGGIWCRKLKDKQADIYDDEQIRIINNKILYSSDGFQTSKSAFGSFIYDGKKYSGLLAEAVIGGLVQGAQIRGGYLEIGGTGGRFVVNEDGSVQILGPDNNNIYAAKGDVSVLQQALKYKTELTYDNSTIFSDIDDTCTITCKVYRSNDTTGEYEDITSKLAGNATFNWIRDPSPWTPSITPETDATLAFNQIKITHEDVKRNAQFECQIQFDDTILNS